PISRVRQLTEIVQMPRFFCIYESRGLECWYTQEHPMTEPQNQPQTGGGTDKLPQPWAIAVQLIGTFGLAVFLVVYYVLVMQPKEAARYDELKASIDNLASLVENQQALIGRDQESGLEQLFILGVVHDIADYIGRERQSKEEDLKREIDNILYNRTRLVTG